jgi:hypothetical protein
VLPVTSDYIALHPRGAQDYDDFLGAVHQLSADTGAKLLDLHAQPVPESDFADTHHLNRAGQEWFSQSLGGWLRDAGVTVPRRCP